MSNSFQKKQVRVRFDEDNVYYRTYFYGPSIDIANKDIARVEFMRMIFTSQELWNCGPSPFDSLRIMFNSDKWTAEFESLVREPENNGQKTKE